MKKQKRIIIGVLLLCILTALSGCYEEVPAGGVGHRPVWIDWLIGFAGENAGETGEKNDKRNELEDIHAVFTDESKAVVEFRGVTYNQVPVTEAVSGQFDAGTRSYVFNGQNGENVRFAGKSQMVYITAPGEELPSGYESGGFTGTLYEDIGVVVDGAGNLYITDEKRDGFLTVLEKPEVTEYAVSISTGGFVQIGTADTKARFVQLGPEQAEILDKILLTDEFIMTDEELAEYNAAVSKGKKQVVLGLFYTDKDMFLCSELANIIFPEGKDSKTAEVYVFQQEETAGSRVIPEEYIGLFTEFMN